MVDVLEAQQVPPQPVPGDLPQPAGPTPTPGPSAPPAPVTDPTQEPPPEGDPDVIDPTIVPDAPMVALRVVAAGSERTAERRRCSSAVREAMAVGVIPALLVRETRTKP